MKRTHDVVSIIGAVALGCTWGLLSAPAAAQPSSDPVIFLDQGWSQADRELWYHTPQGSSVASYDIYMNLEVPGSQGLFRSDANSARLGLIPQAANPRTNPDGFQVGVTKNVVTADVASPEDLVLRIDRWDTPDDSHPPARSEVWVHINSSWKAAWC